ncbi:F-box domain-containing protein [Mycena kentingensis (nom. inval.)]|nr:F-box domain-containing protein [Mycena kentingensis (nom. inval.)]
MARRKTKLVAVDGFDLMEFPMDVVFEICVLLEPIDLIHLARTNKALRTFLLDRSSRGIWRAALARVEGLPGPPSHLSEPAWAHVVFDQFCKNCLSNLRDDPMEDCVWWEFGGRFCAKCMKTLICTTIPLKLKALVLVADWTNVLPRIQNGRSYNRWFYLISTHNELRDRLSAAQSVAAREEVIRQRTEETRVIMEHSKLCREWSKQQIENYKAAVNQKAKAKVERENALRISKAEIMEKKLIAQGWTDRRWMKEGKLLAQLQTYPEIGDSTKANVRSCPDLLKTIIDALTADKRTRILSSDLTTFKNSYDSIISQQEVDSLDLAILPRLVDILLIPQVRAILNASVEDARIDQDLISLLRPVLPALLQTWASEALSQLNQHARQLLGLPDSTPTPLELAIAVTSCPTPSYLCNKQNTYFHELLTHSCHSINPGRSWTNPDCGHSSAASEPYEAQARAVAQRNQYCVPCSFFSPSVFRFPTGDMLQRLKSLVRVYGRSPETATAKEMEQDTRLVRCVAFLAEGRGPLAPPPMNWTAAVQHSIFAHFGFLAHSVDCEWEICE